MPDGVELAKAYVTVIPSMQGAQAAITSGMTGAASSAGTAAGATLGSKTSASAGKTLSAKLPGALSSIGAGAGGSMAGSMAGGFESTLSKAGMPGMIAAVGVAVGAGLFAIGDSFDVMNDTIAVGTGATGEALEGLQDVALEVAQNVPAGLDAVGSTVADLNTRLGISGDELEEVAQKYLEAGEILGQDVDVNKTTAAFNAFHIEGAATGDALDDLFTVSQATGIGINELATAVTSNAAAMQSLGFSFEETAAMAGALDKAGLSASGTFAKMSKGLVTLAKDGEEPVEAFDRVTGEIQDLIDAGDKAAAIDMASELFGTRGAAQFVGALESGALSIEDMTAALAENDDAILTTAEETKSFAQAWEEVKNNLLIALEPFASGVFDLVSEVLIAIVPIIQTIADVFQLISPVVEGVFSVITTVVTNAMTVIQGIISAVTSIIQGDWSGAWEAIKGAFSTAWSNILGDSDSKVRAFVENIIGKVENLRDRIKGIIDKIKGFFNFSVSKPHIPLPHFKISPDGWKVGDLLKGVKPSLSVEWYARGGIADGATLYGVGEAGPEAILPLTRRGLEPFAQALDAQRSSTATTIVNIDGARINDVPGIQEAVAAFLFDLQRLNVMQGGAA